MMNKRSQQKEIKVQNKKKYELYKPIEFINRFFVKTSEE